MFAIRKQSLLYQGSLLCIVVLLGVGILFVIPRTRFSFLNRCSTVNERQRKNKMNRNTNNISSVKQVVRKFLEVSRYSHAKQQQRNVHIKCAALANETY